MTKEKQKGDTLNSILNWVLKVLPTKEEKKKDKNSNQNVKKNTELIKKEEEIKIRKKDNIMNKNDSKDSKPKDITEEEWNLILDYRAGKNKESNKQIDKQESINKAIIVPNIINKTSEEKGSSAKDQNEIKYDNESIKKENNKKEESIKSIIKNKAKDKELLEKDISCLNFSIKTYNALCRNNIKQIKDIIILSDEDILSLRNLGEKGLYEIKYNLELIKTNQPELKKEIKNLDNKKSVPGEYKKNQINNSRFENKDMELIKENKKTQGREKERDQTERSLEFFTKYFEQNDTNYKCFKDIVEELKSNSSEEITNIDLINRISIILETFDTSISIYIRNTNHTIPNFELILDKIKIKIMKEYFKSCFSINYLNMLNSIFANEEKWIIVFKRISNRTLNQISNECKPQLSRERIRQIINEIEKKVKFNSNIMREDLDLIIKKEYETNELEFINSFLSKHKLFAIKDKLDSYDKEFLNNKFFKLHTEMDLVERLNLYKKYSISIPKEEFDYHYDSLLNSRSYFGKKYWTIDILKEFVYRHAKKLGEPYLMPKQTSFPRGIGGVITNFGGQSAVANRLGLEYQGQLVSSEKGRTYWDDNRLIDLVEEVRRSLNLRNDQFPSDVEITNYMTKTEKFNRLKPSSAIAAIRTRKIWNKLNTELINKNKELSELVINNKSEKVINVEKVEYSTKAFKYNKEIAKVKQAKDLIMRNTLSEIFEDENDNSEMPLETNKIKPNNSNKYLEKFLQVIGSSFNTENELNKIEIENIARGLGITLTVLIDQINEISLDRYESLLIEEEDDLLYLDEVNYRNFISEKSNE